MTQTEARKILGLDPDEDPGPHLADLQVVRGEIAALAASAPSKLLAERYEKGLVEFDQALEAVLNAPQDGEMITGEPLDSMVPETSSPEPEKSIFVEENLVDPQVEPPPIATPQPSSGKPLLMVALVLLLLSAAGLGGWYYLKLDHERNVVKQRRVDQLALQGEGLIENRRWPEATAAFDRIEGISPGSAVVVAARRSIAEGMAEEQSQFTGYWKGQAISSFEAGNWAAAEEAAREVLAKYPDETELLELLTKIDAAKSEEKRQAVFDAVRKQIADRDFDAAMISAKKLTEDNPSDPEAQAVLESAMEAKAKAAVDLENARVLQARASERDTGEYDEEAMEWLREAVSLAPDDLAITALYEKMAAYTRTVRIPEDVATLAEALASARDRDRLVIGAGTWEGPFPVTAAIELEGVPGKTILQCRAHAGSVISVSAGVKGARLGGLTIRHLSFDPGRERFSLVLVAGGEVAISDCRFEQGSGHGLAVSGGGRAEVVRCHFSENGWNGIAALDPGSRLEASENLMKGNYQNGIECWNGATATLAGNRCLDNSRNGIHIDAGSAAANVSGNTLSGNREYGMILSSAGSGRITENTIGENLLGGMVIKAGAVGTVVTENVVSANAGPGLVLEKGLPLESFVGNRISGNTGKQLVSEAEFPES